MALATVILLGITCLMAAAAAMAALKSAKKSNELEGKIDKLTEKIEALEKAK